jgi:hypothetical protein
MELSLSHLPVSFFSFRNLSLAVCGRLQSFVLPSASPPILRRTLYRRPRLHLSIRLLHEQDGSKTHCRGLPTNGGEEWLGTT